MFAYPCMYMCVCYMCENTHGHKHTNTRTYTYACIRRQACMNPRMRGIQMCPHTYVHA
jgi:hypothetical protein